MSTKSKKRQELREYMCKIIGHKFDEFKMHSVICSRCRICRSYTAEDLVNLKVKQQNESKGN